MAKKIEEEKKYEKIIHVKAESKFISINALIPEKKVEGILIGVRNNFTKMKSRFDPHGQERLVVQTCVHNPTIF